MRTGDERAGPFSTFKAAGAATQLTGLLSPGGFGAEMEIVKRVACSFSNTGGSYTSTAFGCALPGISSSGMQPYRGAQRGRAGRFER